VATVLDRFDELLTYLQPMALSQELQLTELTIVSQREVINFDTLLLHTSGVDSRKETGLSYIDFGF